MALQSSLSRTVTALVLITITAFRSDHYNLTLVYRHLAVCLMSGGELTGCVPTGGVLQQLFGKLDAGTRRPRLHFARHHDRTQRQTDLHRAMDQDPKTSNLWNEEHSRAAICGLGVH